MRKPNKGSMSIDLDPGANTQVPGAAEDPGVILGPIDNANHGGINSIAEIPPESSGTTVQYFDNSFNDDVAQYRKADEARPDHAELNRVRNQAYSYVGETQDNANLPFTGRQDSDPKGG